MHSQLMPFETGESATTDQIRSACRIRGKAEPHAWSSDRIRGQRLAPQYPKCAESFSAELRLTLVNWTKHIHAGPSAPYAFTSRQCINVILSDCAATERTSAMRNF